MAFVATGVYLAARAHGGAPVGGEFQVNLATLEQQSYPDVAKESDGDFVVVWSSASQDGEPPGIFFRRFDSGGAPVGGELQVNSYTAGIQN